MTRNDEKQKQIHIKVLADLIDAPNEYWLNNILARLGITVDDEGYIDAATFRAMLESISLARKTFKSDGTMSQEQMIRKAQMGISTRAFGLWLKDYLATFGLKQVGSFRNRVTLENESGQNVWITNYFTLKVRPGGKKASFSVSGLNLPEIPWVVFAVQPWGQVYLRRREEIIENLADHIKKKGTAVITISAGNTDDLFEKRIDEFLKDENAWK